eukprot:scaffold290421_cov18-Tisochrysis_lutea.AAC.1
MASTPAKCGRGRCKTVMNNNFLGRISEISLLYQQGNWTAGLLLYYKNFVICTCQLQNGLMLEISKFQTVNMYWNCSSATY